MAATVLESPVRVRVFSQGATVLVGIVLFFHGVEGLLDFIAGLAPRVLAPYHNRPKRWPSAEAPCRGPSPGGRALKTTCKPTLR